MDNYVAVEMRSSMSAASSSGVFSIRAAARAGNSLKMVAAGSASFATTAKPNASAKRSLDGQFGANRIRFHRTDHDAFH
jgi:hypothetical protein